MPLFGLFKKKPKYGFSSKISELKTPYLIKPGALKKVKRVKGNLKKAVFTTPKIKPKTNRAKLFFALVLAFGIISFTVYALFFSNYFLIKKYTIDDDDILNDNQSLNDLLDPAIGKNLVTFDETNIRSAIISKHPEIKNIKIKKIFPDSLDVIVEKYPLTANIIDIVNGIQKKFLVNSRGLIIQENAENPDLPYIRLESKEFLSLNSPFLGDNKRSAERLTYAIQAINLFEEKFAIRILYAQIKVQERELNLYTEKQFYVILDMEKGSPDYTQGLLEQIEKLKKALPKLDIYNTPLLYIDLRISGTNTEKIIFKRK